MTTDTASLPVPGRGSGGEWLGHARGTGSYRRLLAALFFAGIATFAQLYSPQATLPLIARDLHVGAADSALTVSAATVGLAVGVIPWSIVSDRIGRVRSMAIAAIAATVIGLLVPFAPTFELLLAGRVLEGLAVGGVPAIAIAYLNEEVSVAHSAGAAGTYVAGTSMGGLLGRLVSGPVADFLGWRVGIFATAVVCAVAVGLFIALAPAPRRFIPHTGRGANPEGTFGHRMLANLRSPRQLVLYAQGFLLMGGFVALYNYLGFRLGAAPFGLPQSIVSLVFVAYLSGTASSALGGRIASRWSRRVVLLGGVLMMIVGMLITLSDVLALVLVGLVIATAGFFAAHAMASGWTAHEAVVGKAQAASLYNLFYYAGSSLFGWLGGIFFAGFGWPGTALMVCGLALVAGVLAAAVLRRRSPGG